MKERKHGGLKYLLLLFIPAAGVLVYFASQNASFAEWYATNFYKWLSLGVDFVSSLLPFSLAEILVLLFALWACIYIVKFVIKLIRGRSPRGRTVLSFFINPVLLAGILLFVFVTNAGINYYRQPFAEAAGLSVTKYSEQELTELCYYLAEQANGLRNGLKEDKNGVMKLSGTLEQTAQKAKDVYDKMQDKYPTLTKGYGKTKQLYLSHYLSYTQITGLFFPIQWRQTSTATYRAIPSRLPCAMSSHTCADICVRMKQISFRISSVRKAATGNCNIPALCLHSYTRATRSPHRTAPFIPRCSERLTRRSSVISAQTMRTGRSSKGR